MSLAPLKLFHGVVPNPEAGIYTSPGGVVLRKLLIVNTSGAGAQISVSVAGHRVLNGKVVAASDVYPLVVGPLPLDPGQTITALSSVAGALTILATGWTI